MKGYSFQELVKLAEAAVKRAGDAMTGNLTAPKVLVSSAQGTEGNALTRKDYVDSAIAAGDALQVSKSGDTMTGNLAVPKVLVSGAQGAESNALTRKDYVDNALASKLGNTGVQTINGELILSSYAPILTLNETDTGKKWLLVADGFETRFQMDGTSGTEGWAVNGAGSMSLRDPHTMTAQGNSVSSLTRKDYVDSATALKVNKAGDTMTGNLAVPKVLVSGAQGAESNALTRKDYVDGQVATRAPMAHTHTVAAITDLKPQDVRAAANTLAVRDEAADIYARLLRTTYQDQSDMGGAIAFRINNSNDNYTRYCSNPSAIRNWMKGAKTEWQMSWRAYIEDPGYPMTEYHIPGKAAVITYLTGDGNYRIDSSNGAGGSVGTRMWLDPSGNLFTTAAIYEAGQRVYSPNNPPHYSHNHTAAQGNADIVADSYGQIGTYGFFYNLGAAASVGTQRSGSTLRWSGARNNSTANLNPPGTWKCVGHAFQNGASEGEACTLWIRIA